MDSSANNPIPFKAETRQLMDILIHSLYSEREIFLRELISNASDALTRVDFELVRSRDVLDPAAELAIRIQVDDKENTLTISDSGIGMTAEELIENLGTIARSGAREFIQAAQEAEAQGESRKITDLIGQFGVGFYSAFMVAEWIRVTSRSFRPDAQAATWYSTGSDTFTVEPAEKAERGTTVVVKLKKTPASSPGRTACVRSSNATPILCPSRSTSARRMSRATSAPPSGASRRAKWKRTPTILFTTN